ncbi:MAG TPA: HD domain-containing phosphohydrolase [Chloroflexota bacterium]|nr:HD domain-containing phosphohydrolase [Chloroflexota bacterium]
MAGEHIGEFTHLSGTPPPERRTDSSLAELLCALSFASGLALGGRMEHGIGSAYIGLRIAGALGLPEEDREAIYYGALIKDAGCTACSIIFDAFFPNDEVVPLALFMIPDERRMGELMAWMSRGIPKDKRLALRLAKLLPMMLQCGAVMRETRATHSEVGEMFARRLGFGEHVQRAVRLQGERSDGRGVAYSLPGDQIPAAARVLSVARVTEACHGFEGRACALEQARKGAGGRFDPDVVAAFLELAQQDEFWEPLEKDTRQETVLAMRPSTSAEVRTEEQLDAVCEALADFVDFRSTPRWNHSTEVAEQAVALAGRLGLSQAEQRRTRRAALLHDLGMVAVPVGVAAKQDRLSTAEQEQLRLHAYYTGRVLERVAPLQSLALEASSDHEWFNGQGYHRRLAGESIPLIGRIIAAAEAWTNLTEEDAIQAEDQLARFRSLSGNQLDPVCCEALEQIAVGSPAPKPLRRPASSDKLTDREIEVLNLLAHGLSNRQIAGALVISNKTVEHHLEHIYDKLDISTRTSAVAYAIHHGLVSAGA